VAFGEALQPEFKTYAAQVIKNAQALAMQLQQRSFKIVSNGTDNHLLLVDLRSIGMTGKRADQLVSQVNITANKNTVPFDPESPFVTSGLRLGSAALTTRGMGTTEFTEIANILADCLLNPEDEATRGDCRHRVASLCERFPLYPHLQVPVPTLV
jgi:glycine hydroxymethyltransferase